MKTCAIYFATFPNFHNSQNLRFKAFELWHNHLRLYSGQWDNLMMNIRHEYVYSFHMHTLIT